ncbi:hypothetical protein EJ03DRAFT_114661 [Teratosphaeria nubilosa]|uniref:CASTOR ACT domain-containing protein n=1 Tax=Teratosphaeria nubilosa TaxID=161662 RepID=A0A6G1L7B1_9PEZI|nr:hypothetical protein EJ03DRAFT_114661 [Teratosphaeria nubilosa]
MDSGLTDSTTVLNAQIGFLDTNVALIHIPSPAYPVFVQAVSQLLLRNTRTDHEGNEYRPDRPWKFWHPFVNVSLTNNECSVVCPRHEADALFQPLLHVLDASLRDAVSISREDYSVIMIGGEGLEAGQRVLDLTTPLAMAGISIYFITSYWSDFILVPWKARPRVIHALEARGFVFEADDNGQNGHMKNPASPILHPHQRNSSVASFDWSPTPTTPPPGSPSGLQVKTFQKLNAHNVLPHVDRSIELVTCAGIKETTTSSSANNFTEGKLQLGLIKCLTSFPPPKFLSITLTDFESASLTLEKRLLSLFYHDGEDLLLGKDGPEQVPITFDLEALPTESTGIVCGVASKLIDGMKGKIGSQVFNMSYLSTARAGHAVVYEDELDDALEALKGLEMNGAGGH